MTTLKMCCIHDTKAEAWMTPLFFQANGQAVRSFGDAIRDKNSEMGKHPEDYHLYCLGEFDPQSGVVIACEPVHLIHGANVKEIDS